MPTVSGRFSGLVDIQQALTVGDRDAHVMMVARVRGSQQSPDPLWNEAVIVYTAVLDLVAGAGDQRGYFVNTHADGDRDWGTFTGTVTTVGAGLQCDGTWETVAGSGRYEGVTGKGTFRMRITSRDTVEASWDGAYALGVAAAGSQIDEPTPQT
jgi:hypothetical protein